MKTLSTLMLATLALASLSADHTTDAVGVHSHLTPSQIASIQQRVSESRRKSLPAKVHVPVQKPAVKKPEAPSMAKALHLKDEFEAVGFDQGSGMHLMNSNVGSDDGSDGGSDDGSPIDETSNSGDGSGVSFSHGGVETTNFYGVDSNSGSGEDSSSGSGERDNQSYELSDFYGVDSNSGSGSSVSSNDGSGSDATGTGAPGGYDGSLDDSLGLGKTEAPIGGTQAFDDDNGGNGEGEGNGNPDGTVSLRKKESPVAKEHHKHTEKKEVAKHEAKTQEKKYEAKTHNKKHNVKDTAKKHADTKKDGASHKKLSGEKGDLRKGKVAKVEQKYADNALEEEAQKAGEAIVSRLAADSSPFGVKGSEMLVTVGAIAGAVVGVIGVLFAAVNMRRQHGEANSGQRALVSELPEPESGRPAEATMDALTSSGIELDDDNDDFSDSDNDAQHEEEGAFANAAHVV